MTVRFEEAAPPLEALMPLYESVGWTAYVREPAALERAVQSSTYVLSAWEGDRLVGLARALSDEASVWFLQDLLVVPDRQGAGLGATLMARCRERFAEVTRGVLLTDADGPGGFYAKSGLKPAKDLGLAAWILQ